MAQEQDTKKQASPENGAGGNAAGGEARSGASANRGLEQARREMNEAIQTLRMEMARLDLQKAGRQARSWVDENPTLAAFIGIGAGLMVGRALAEALRPAPPPPWHVQAKQRAGAWADGLGDFATGVGAVLAAQAALAAKAAHTAGETVAHQARGLSTDVTRRVEDWSDTLGKRLGDLSESATEAAESSAKALRGTSRDVQKAMRRQSKTTRKKMKGDFELPDAVVNAARAAAAAVVLKKANDWLRVIK